MKKVENYLKSIERLSEANAEYIKYPHNDVIRDGLIQRFEFTFELSWKALKEYLIEQGIQSDLYFPKQVLRSAFESSVIEDDAVWLDMLEARNRTSYIYDDRNAAVIAQKIMTSFIPALKKLADSLKSQ